MSEEKKKEKKSIIDEIDKNHEIGLNYIDTVDLLYDSSLVKAREKLKEKHGDSYLKKLDEDEKVKEEFTNLIVNHFLEYGKNKYGWKIENMTEPEIDAHLQGLVGISKGLISKYVNDSGKDYIELHKQFKEQHLNELKKSHYSLLSEKINKNNIEEIINKLNIEGDTTKIKNYPDLYKDRLISDYIQYKENKRKNKKKYA